jgi:glycosyltransferase involved in cell wall biosynthesis
MLSLNPVRLSVVVVCRNEERNIARCLTSIVSASHLVDGGVEVVVVDSASRDRTVDAALAFPVRVVLLDAAWPLSPAAGRFHGGLAARGDYVQFIDGDMALDAGWLPAALRALDADEKLGGIGGIERQAFLEGGAVVGGRDNPYAVPPHEAPARVLPGAALFRRTALIAAGGFDPYLSSEEEAELCYRLMKAGYTLRTLPIPITTHYSARRRSLSELSRRMRGRLYRGTGQVLRRSLAQGLVLRHAWRLRTFLAFGAFLVAGIVALIAWPVTQSAMLFTIWLLLAATMFAVLTVRKRSLGQAALSLAILTCIAWELAAGFRKPLPPPSQYPRDARIIRREESSAAL